MGLLFREKVYGNADLWLWKVEENEDFFLEQLNLSEADSGLLAKFTAPSRRLEWLASRYLLQQLVGGDVSVTYNVDGKPGLVGVDGHVSISHSHKIVGVLYHPTASVGLDVERVSVRPTKVIHRFLDDEEQLLVEKDENFEAITRAWCSKEALFKLLGQHCYTFKGDFKLTTVIQPLSGDAVFFVKPLNLALPVFFKKIDDHVVAYTMIQTD